MPLPFQNNSRTTESDVLQRAVGKDRQFGALVENLREGKSGTCGSWSSVTPASLNDVIRTLNTPKTLQRRCEASTSLSPAVSCPALRPPEVHFSGTDTASHSLMLAIPVTHSHESEVKVAQSCPALCDPMYYTVHGILQAEYRSGSLSLLPGIFPTQGSNPGLLHCKRILYQLSHQGSPRILEWVAYPFSSGSSRTQELNQDLQHCRRILYQLSYQGSP